MIGVTGGFAHHPNDFAPGFNADCESMTALTSAVNPNVTRIPRISNIKANAITNPVKRNLREEKNLR